MTRKLEVLALAANVAIRVAEARYVYLTDSVKAEWQFKATANVSRSIKVVIASHDERKFTIYFDAPTLIAEYDSGQDLFEIYKGQGK